jgi:ATP-binding cassette subfamily F protein uup
VVTGKNTRIAYYDQQRAQLDPEWTVYEAALGERIHGDVRRSEDFIELGERRVALRDYLEDLLFPVPMQNMQVKALSGGERNRLLLARLFALPANVLVLDEPTNDLDIDTLELLEELLQNYAGTVFLVSHDRRFLDNVVTSTIAWEGDQSPGLWREYEGGYEDWKQQRERALRLRDAAAPKATPERMKPSAAPADAVPKKRKLSYKEQRELDELPGLIEALEAEQKELGELLAKADFYASDPKRAADAQTRHARIDDELLEALERWETLSAR